MHFVDMMWDRTPVSKNGVRGFNGTAENSETGQVCELFLPETSLLVMPEDVRQRFLDGMITGEVLGANG